MLTALERKLLAGSVGREKTYVPHPPVVGDRFRDG